MEETNSRSFSPASHELLGFFEGNVGNKNIVEFTD